MKNAMRSVFATAALFVATAGAWGQVTGYDAYKTNDYTQTSAAQPTDPFNYRFDARLFTLMDGDAAAGTLTGGTAGPVNFDVASPTFLFYRDSGYSTEAARDAAWPTGAYTYAITAGTLAPAAGGLDVPDAEYAATVPYLTGSSYADLQGMDPAAAHTVTFNSYDPISDHQENSTFFSVFDNETGALVFNAFGPTTAFQAATIPGDLLENGKAYTYSVIFTTRLDSGGQDDFASAFATEGFDLNTSGTFTTLAIPEPGALAVLVPGVLVLARRTRRAL